jgi:hypothetical protein
MALELSLEAQAFLDQTNVKANIILEVSGFPNLYGAVQVTRLAKIGDPIFIGDGTLIGGASADPLSLPYVSIEGTTNTINQKLDQDKGGGTSITSFKVRLIDNNGEVTRAFSPGVTVPDILGREAVIYWQPLGSKHPQDSARLFVGIITSGSFGAGFVDIRVDHPEQLKRQKLLPVTTTKLAVDMTDVSTTAFLDSIEGFVNPQENLTSYIKIDDEVIGVQAFATGAANVLTRGEFGTIPVIHEIGTEVESFYRIQGEATELALRLMLSDPDSQEFATGTATRFVTISGSESIPGAVFFDSPNIQDELGLVVGDEISVTTGANVSNLFGYSEIAGFGTNAAGSYIIVSNTLVPETDVTATVLFKSKYNKLNFGCALKPYQVDVAQFESLKETFGAQFFDYDFPIKDEIEAKTFIDEQILYPSGLFSLPRKGRISAGISAPPIIGPDVKTISADTVTNPTQLMMSRSINQAFYNGVVYKIAEDFVDDKFRGAVITSSANSTNRISIGNRVLTIESSGIQDTVLNRNKIEAISTRYLDRYQFGAERLEVGVNFKTAFTIEPGDTVILEGDTLGLSDITNGTRDFNTRVMEVTNKQINLKTGKASLELQDTNLSTFRRYGTWAPASLVAAGSGTNTLLIKRSFGVEEPALEKTKWEDYLLQDIVVRSPEHDVIYETKLVGFSTSNSNQLIINPPLAGIPLENYIVEPPIYDESSKQVMKFYKALHCFFNPQVNATGGTTTSFDVGAGDIDKFNIEFPVTIHLEDYSETAEANVLEISGTTVTIDKTLDFSVTSSHLIDLIGFGDEGSSYAFY